MKASIYFNKFQPISKSNYSVEYSLEAIMQFKFLSNINSFHSEIAEKGLSGKHLTDKQLWVLSFELEKRAESFNAFLSQKENEYELEQVAKKESTIEYKNLFISKIDGGFEVTTLDGGLPEAYGLGKTFSSIDKAKIAIDESTQDNDDDYWS